MSDYQSRNIDTGAGTSGMGSTGTGSTGGTEQGGTMDRMQSMASDAMDRGNDKMSHMGESVSRMGQEVGDRLRSGMERVRTMDRSDLNVMYDDVLEQARMHPGRTILVSAAVGMVLGLMMRGGRQNF